MRVDIAVSESGYTIPSVRRNCAYIMNIKMEDDVTIIIVCNQGKKLRDWWE